MAGRRPVHERKADVTVSTRGDGGPKMRWLEGYDKRDCMVYLCGDGVFVESCIPGHDTQDAHDDGEGGDGRHARQEDAEFLIPFVSVCKVSSPRIFGRDRFEVRALTDAGVFIDPIRAYDSLFTNIDYAALRRAAEQEKRENDEERRRAREATQRAQEAADRAYEDMVRQHDTLYSGTAPEHRPAPPMREIVSDVMPNISHEYADRLKNAEWALKPRSKEKFWHARKYLKESLKETKIKFRMSRGFAGNRHDECVAWKDMLHERIMQL